jgi:hypothetical protein
MLWDESPLCSEVSWARWFGTTAPLEVDTWFGTATFLEVEVLFSTTTVLAVV